MTPDRATSAVDESEWTEWTTGETVIYCHKCSGPSLDKEMALGRLPYPVKYGGRDKWRREDIDRALERLFNGSETPDWRAKLYEGRAA